MHGNFYCTFCLNDGKHAKAIHRHHIFYPSDVTVPLCKPCHIVITTFNTQYSRDLGRALTIEERIWAFYMFLRQAGKPRMSDEELKRILVEAGVPAEKINQIYERRKNSLLSSYTRTKSRMKH